MMKFSEYSYILISKFLQMELFPIDIIAFEKKSGYFGKRFIFPFTGFPVSILRLAFVLPPVDNHSWLKEAVCKRSE